jgi:hypothetical protein
MKTDVVQSSTLPASKSKKGSFKTMRELADEKYQHFIPKLEEVLKDHPHFQKKA